MTTRAQRSAKSPKIEALIGEDHELLKALVKEAVQEVLEAEMTDALGARAGERTTDRTGYRSGYYSRGLVTRIGKLELRVPRDREGRFSTELFERYQRAEKALVSALAEMYVQGVSTRKVKAITEELCGHTFSASTISRINKSLDGLLQRFAQRRLDEAYPYVILDARYEKVRLDGVIQSQAVLAHALGAALPEAHRLGRTAHRRDAELLPPAPPTPQASEIDQHARAAQRRDFVPLLRAAARDSLKRRTRVVRIFPNPASCLRLVRALCAEIHEAWLEDHHYLNMDYWKEQKKDFIRTAA